MTELFGSEVQLHLSNLDLLPGYEIVAIGKKEIVLKSYKDYLNLIGQYRYFIRVKYAYQLPGM